MTNRLYVGNLPVHATEDVLKQHFTSCGEVVSVSVMANRETGQSHGFAIVEMTDAEGAERALTELNGKPFQGRSLTLLGNIEGGNRGEGADGNGGRRGG